MAKTQNLSLNPTKISGTCGRLMCCLKYEQDAYEDLIRTSPKADSFVDTPEGRGTVVEVDLLRQRVKVKMEAQPEVIATFANTDIAILRNGKAKKNDPPIPADLAPISGNNKRRRPKPEEQPEEGRMFLDPIRFRYSTETIVEEEVAPEAPEAVADEPKATRSRRRNKKSGKKPASGEKPAQQEKAARQEKAPKQEKTPKSSEEKVPKPKTDAPAGEKPQNKSRRRHYRHKPKSAQKPKE